TYAEQHFLAEAHFLIAAVEPGRELAVVRRVLRQIRVDEIQIDSSHTDLPDQGGDGPAVHFDLDLARRTGRRHSLLDRGIQSIEGHVLSLLPAFRSDPLSEVALGIHESYPHNGNSQITGLLAVIARQDAQPAAVNRNRAVESEFGRKIRDRAS